MKIFGIGLAILTIILIGWLIYEFFEEVFGLYKTADADIKLGVMTAAGSALAFIVNNAVQSSRERKARLFEAKRNVYDEFFLSFNEFFGNNLDSRTKNKNTIEAIRKLRVGIMTWGSAKTVHSFVKFMKESADDSEVGKSKKDSENDNPKIIFQKVEDLLRALRKDLGHSDGSLQSFALTKMILRGDQHKDLD